MNPEEYQVKGEDGNWRMRNPNSFYENWNGYIVSRILHRMKIGHKHELLEDVIQDVYEQLACIQRSGTNRAYSHNHWIDLALRTVFSKMKENQRAIKQNKRIQAERNTVDFEDELEEVEMDIGLDKYLEYIVENAKLEDTKTVLSHLDSDTRKKYRQILAEYKGISREWQRIHELEDENWRTELRELIKRAQEIYG